jgi:hypothetical protein
MMVFSVESMQRSYLLKTIAATVQFSVGDSHGKFEFEFSRVKSPGEFLVEFQGD